MNYFPFHLGDYSAHTGHLDLLEDLAYRRCLDAYYLREGPLPKDASEVARIIRMRDHAATVRDVLNEFFELCDDGWRHARCDQEIDRMRDKQSKARASAQASVNARKANAQRTFNERSTDVKLPTPTPTPIKKKEEAPEGVSPEVWDSFVKQRKSKKAQITANVLAAIDREAKKAGWSLDAALNEIVVRNWQSFKAEWVTDKQNQTETVYQRSMRLKMQEAVPSIARQSPEPYQDASDFFLTIDMETQKAIEVSK